MKKKGFEKRKKKDEDTRPLKKKKREEEEQPEEEEPVKEQVEDELEEEEERSEVEEPDGVELPGIPIAPSSSAAAGAPKSKPGVIFIFERACLEVGKVGKTEAILNSDEHSNYLRRQGKNPADYRPDIIHQALLAVLDSPLTKAGRLQALYVKTEQGHLIRIQPNVRMPRTIKRFYGLMAQLLPKMHIKASGKRGSLLELVKNPVTQYLPANSRRIGLSYSSPKLVPLRDYVAAATDDTTLVFVVGAMAHGKINADYTDDFISVSGYPLSAACCINRICSALESKWKIL